MITIAAMTLLSGTLINEKGPLQIQNHLAGSKQLESWLDVFQNLKSDPRHSDRFHPIWSSLVSTPFEAKVSSSTLRNTQSLHLNQKNPWLISLNHRQCGLAHPSINLPTHRHGTIHHGHLGRDVLQNAPQHPSASLPQPGWHLCLWIAALGWRIYFSDWLWVAGNMNGDKQHMDPLLQMIIFWGDFSEWY